MDETQYQRISEDCINSIADTLEAADAEGSLDVEYQAGVLTVDLSSGKQLLVSKHTASRQIWLSSPISGGLHFSHDGKAWCLADGRTLAQVLSQELKQLAGIDVTFA